MKMDVSNGKNENKSDSYEFGTLIENRILYLTLHKKLNNQINIFTT